MSRLRPALLHRTRIALDTSVFIYALEAHPRYGSIAKDVLQWLEEPGHEGVASTLAITEVLVQPYRQGQHAQARGTFALLSKNPHLEWIAAGVDVADRAARLRAAYGLRTPDAIHIASALHAGASAFITNDLALGRVTDLDVLVLESLL